MKKAKTPGERLKEVLKRHSIGRPALAKHLGWELKQLDRLCTDQARVTTLKAKELAAALGTSPRFWLMAQMDLDLTIYRDDFTDPGLFFGIEPDSFLIRKNVPLPPKEKKRRAKKYPLLTIEIGHSFTVACDPLEAKRIKANLRTYVYQVNKRYGTAIKIELRDIEDGIGVWRVE